jgi:hypothetical protein
VIATLTSDRTFEAEIEVKKGRGYVTQEENAREEHEIGQIPLDAIFSPVQRVRYRTENTRVGKMTNYDRLILELWTDGTLTPEMALVEAGKVYRKHLNPSSTSSTSAASSPGAAAVTPARPAAPAAPVAAAIPGVGDDLRKKLSMPISALDLGAREQRARDRGDPDGRRAGQQDRGRAGRLKNWLHLLREVEKSCRPWTSRSAWTWARSSARRRVSTCAIASPGRSSTPTRSIASRCVGTSRAACSCTGASSRPSQRRRPPAASPRSSSRGRGTPSRRRPRATCTAGSTRSACSPGT